VKLPPADAVNELAKRRREAAPPDRTAKELIEKLDDDRYGVRLKAFEDLRQLGPAAREAVADALEHPSLEVRVRATQLLQELGGPLDVRPVMVIEILGLIGTKEAREELRSIIAENISPYVNHAKAMLARTIEPK
jgi:HEAT repeat protein